MSNLKGKNILLGVTGGISIYKSCELVRALIKEGANIDIVMTPNAEKFVSKMTFQSLSGRKVYTNMYDSDESSISHIDLADNSDLIVICPATANFISKYANGIADTLLLNILIATKSNVLICPAMNVNMFTNPLIQENINKLSNLGIEFVEPGVGDLACGWEGKGRLADIDKILMSIKKKVSKSDLAKEKVLITCGATREYLDPVRFLSNPSSGKMGFCLANEFYSRGAELEIVSGYVEENFELFPKYYKCESSEEMQQHIIKELDSYSVIIKSAAVGDYKFKEISKKKIKKEMKQITFEMEATVDILEYIGSKKKTEQILVGFSAETDNVIENSLKKIQKKNLDFIVANDVSEKDSGFGKNSNFSFLISKDGKTKELGLISKELLSKEIADKVKEIRLSSS
jgi:phosphopantothenoylcysteine decarboxylase/phosphopantothenate--cysteine ligase|tara:strand:- start:1450 stop:2655 length:1206 start_codon:yes stop_codon:yes gene_type:complete